MRMCSSVPALTASVMIWRKYGELVMASSISFRLSAGSSSVRCCRFGEILAIDRATTNSESLDARLLGPVHCF